MDAVQSLSQGTCITSIEKRLLTLRIRRFSKIQNFIGTLAGTAPWKTRKSAEVVRAAWRDIYDVMIAAFLSKTLD